MITSEQMLIEEIYPLQPKRQIENLLGAQLE